MKGIILMDFLIADTFTHSLAKLTGEEQKAVKMTAFDLQMNSANPGMSFHKLENAKDKNFWSVRVSRDIRLIVHKTLKSLLLCYVDHHDKAYDWAERRKLETHPKTGAAQLVEIRETVKEIVIPVYKTEQAETEKKYPFKDISYDALLKYGVPPEWIEDIKNADEDTLLEIVERLPEEAAEALLEKATGGEPVLAQVTSKDMSPFKHPDAQRRFRVVENTEELERALDFPWDKWSVFLHPSQKELVEKIYNGPVRITGSAGTGKTIVALHRAVHLVKKYQDARVLLTTFSKALANSLKIKLRRLVSNEPHLAERLEVYSLNSIGERLYKLHFGTFKLLMKEELLEIIEDVCSNINDHHFALQFLFTEWAEIIDAWQIKTWEAYRDVVRLGRKTRFPESKRELLWNIFDRVLEEIKKRNLVSHAEIFFRLSDKLPLINQTPFDFAVVDEAQDINISQLKFLDALCGNHTDTLFFTGDLGQRIFQQPFSWKTLGVDIKGRTYTLRVNYRTSHQIRTYADKLLDQKITDIDGNVEKRDNTVSLFNGPVPVINEFDSAEDESSNICEWIKERIQEGLQPHEIGIFVRSEMELERALGLVHLAGLEVKLLDEGVETTSGYISVSTMHLAKGLEFKAVVVMACDDQVIPSQDRIETLGDDADLDEIYDTERHLLYVACTRARDVLYVSGVKPVSEFLDDMKY